MGQQQSSNSEEAFAKRSYYDVLAITRNASDEAIKKAYRKKALELHPDRNLDNIEEATRCFAEVQAAYEVLSDPQDRAWYDSHESQVLFGSAGDDNNGSGIPVTTSEDIIKFYAKFHGRNSLNSSTTDFFSVLRQMFEKLAHEEMVFSETNDGKIVDYPSFGHAEDDGDEAVKLFYNAWSGFSTGKSFAWRDKYRLSEATDRRMRRTMEKENRKLREDAIKEFNSTVRTLVSLVRKRDHRLESNIQTDRQRHEALRGKAAAQAAKARAANQARMSDKNIPDWMANRELEDDVSAELWEEKAEEEEAKLKINFECVVCSKLFKTEKQYEAHERSKKHVQSVRQIRQQMRREGLDLGLDGEANESKAKTTAATHDKSQIQGLEKSTFPSNTVLNRDSTDDESEAAENLENDVFDSTSVDDTITDDYASLDYIYSRLGEASDQDSNWSKQQNIERCIPKARKAMEKRARKNAKAALTRDKSLNCATCNELFQSRTQLFRHLRTQPSHASVRGGTR